MATVSGWLAKAGIFKNDPPKSPWGSGGSTGGNGSGGGDNGGGNDGPRNPWAMPPGGRRPRPGAPSALDELLKRARGAGGGGGGGGAPQFPAGFGGRNLWLMIVGALVLVWLGFTSIHPITPEQRGVVTTLGRYSGMLEPGVNWTLPAPFAEVNKVNVQEIRVEMFPKSGNENLMLTGDANIVDLAYQVRWTVADPQKFVFQIADPTETVRATAESAMRAVVATATLNDTIGAGRTAIEERVRALMQRTLDEYNSGVRIEGVEIKNANPPSQVDEDFKQVTAAQQEAESNMNNARAYANQVIALAQGEAAQFDRIYEQYRLAPDVTRRRLYYETMEKVLAKSNKTILDAPGSVPYLQVPAAQPLPEPNAPAPAKPAQGGAQ